MHTCVGVWIKWSRMRFLNCSSFFALEFLKDYSVPTLITKQSSPDSGQFVPIFIHSLIYHHLNGINTTVLFGHNHKTLFWAALIVICSSHILSRCLPCLSSCCCFSLSLVPVISPSLTFSHLTLFSPPTPVNWWPLYIKNNINT